MNQAEIRRLIPALKFAIPTKRRNLSQPEGLLGRMKLIRATVGALIKYERIELNHVRADESRQYTERVRKIDNCIYALNLLVLNRFYVFPFLSILFLVSA